MSERSATFEDCVIANALLLGVTFEKVDGPITHLDYWHAKLPNGSSTGVSTNKHGIATTALSMLGYWVTLDGTLVRI